MKKAVFVTGTDTGVGKTVVSGLLLRFLCENGFKSITQKWVQTGSAYPPEDLLTHMSFIEDGDMLLREHLDEMAPYVFKFPASPHLAASLEEKTISSEKITDIFKKLRQEFDCVIVEGSGGVLVPINDKEMIGDIAQKLELPVIIVAENRLGAINQTLLTVEALQSRQMKIIGIVFNRLSKNEDETILENNKETIKRLSGVNVLGELKFNADKNELYRDFFSIGESILDKLC
ncbi:MAG: dethiobiotin synthase [Candidatus Omnitrophota bacterium]